jgi:hypothetical protein
MKTKTNTKAGDLPAIGSTGATKSKFSGAKMGGTSKVGVIPYTPL